MKSNAMAKDLLARIMPDQKFILKQVLHESPDCTVLRFDDCNRGRQLVVKRQVADAPGIAAAEALMRARLPCVAPILGVHKDQCTQVIIYGFVPGGNLSQRLDQDWSLDQILALCFEILKTLNQTMQLGFCHGNLRPENILFDDKGRVQLMDFGCVTHHNHASEALVIRYPGESASHSADLYALGVIAYRLITGEPPHFIAGMLHTHERFDALPQHLREIFERLFHPDPQARFASAEEALSQLSRHVNSRANRQVSRRAGQRKSHGGSKQISGLRLWQRFGLGRKPSKMPMTPEAHEPGARRRRVSVLGGVGLILCIVLGLCLVVTLLYDDIRQLADF